MSTDYSKFSCLIDEQMNSIISMKLAVVNCCKFLASEVFICKMFKQSFLKMPFCSASFCMHLTVLLFYSHSVNRILRHLPDTDEIVNISFSSQNSQTYFILFKYLCLLFHYLIHIHIKNMYNQSDLL